MADFPVKKNTAFNVSVSLYNSIGQILSNPTISAGDITYSIDFVAAQNPGTLPAVTPASSGQLKIVLAAGEMNGDVIHLQGHDQTSPAEWMDFDLTIYTAANQMADVGTIKTDYARRTNDYAITGAKMDIVDAPNATAVTAIQNGLSKPATAQTITGNQVVNVAQWGGSNIASPAITGEPVVTLASVQAAYSPSKAGDKMDIQDVPNATGLAAVAKTVWDALTSGLTALNSIGKLLVTDIDAKISTAGGGASVGDIDTQLSGTHGAGAWGGAGGSGSKQYTPNKATDPLSNPLDGVETVVNTNATDKTIGVQARGFTNAFGLIATPFQLDPGTYYVWRQLGGYSFTNPETVIVV